MLYDKNIRFLPLGNHTKIENFNFLENFFYFKFFKVIHSPL